MKMHIYFIYFQKALLMVTGSLIFWEVSLLREQQIFYG